VLVFMFVSVLTLPTPVVADERGHAAPAMVALVTAPPSDPLPFRRQMRLTDRVKTADRPFARLLLGGRVMVLAREGSSLSITEVPGAATIEVESGRVAVMVDRENLHPEDLVELRTPHAVVSVPSDTVVVDVAEVSSTFKVLGPRLEVFRLDAATGTVLEPPTAVATQEVLTVGAPVVTPTDVASR
jgi:hypothetical protein